ncbi:fused MFS/spermidine synthase [Candidatus Sumerlaeota bacterium]|nr:fused MFS/spermidine synthase [Candidatus Sumerlaeota bacterium]
MPLTALLAALLSGASALLCETVWARPLALLVGDTVLAVGLVLSVFFAGMALGAWIVGSLAPRLIHPLRVCAGFQIAIALLALFSLPLLGVITDLHLSLLPVLGRGANLPLGLTGASLALLLPTALMGGTVPLLVQALARGQWCDQTSPAARLYAWNTLGGALGALTAGLWLVPVFGLWLTCVIAAALSLLSAWLMTRAQPPERIGTPSPEPPPGSNTPPPLTLGIVAAGAGFTMLGYEVLWTRVLSGVVTDSAASFALMLGWVLIGLAMGGWLAARLDFATRWAPLAVLQLLTGIAAGSAGLWQSSALLPISTVSHWFGLTGMAGGMLTEALATAALALVPSILLGIHLPLLFAAWPGKASGQRWGHMAALNTAGAIAGSLITALMLLPLLHMRGTTLALASVNIALCLVILLAMRRGHRVGSAVILLGWAALIAGVLLVPVSPPLAPDNRLLDRREGLGATVSVVEDSGGHRRMLVNDRYVVGGTGGRMLEMRQALIPALIHPEPRRIFHLGLGTGHTAGALARVPGVERLVTCDNIPDVVHSAHEWFGETNLGLFDSARVEVVVADGRHWLASSGEVFDLIVIDNLLPWTAGAAHLMTREHFEIIHDHLAPGGLACIWLPLHQVMPDQWMMISRTLAEVSPHQTLWLARTEPETSIGFIVSDERLDLAHMLGDPRFQDPALRDVFDLSLIGGPEDVFACLTSSGVVAEDGPLSTDNWPVLEHMGLRAHHTDLALHPDLIGSPAMASNWAQLTLIRESASEAMRSSLSAEVNPTGARIWQRWQSVTRLTEAIAGIIRGDEQSAMQVLQSLEEDPEHLMGRQTLEWTLITLTHGEQWEIAVALGERAREIFDLSPDAEVAWATALLQTHSTYRARRTLQRVLDAHPDHLGAAWELIRALVIDERRDEAQELLEETQRRHPDNQRVQRLRIPRSPE